MTSPTEAQRDRMLTVHLAEYDQLKKEQQARIVHRDSLIYATLAVIAAVVAAAFKASTPYALLALPPATFVLGWTYLANDRKVSAIGYYVRTSLAVDAAAAASPTLAAFGWETHHVDDRRRTATKVTWMMVDLLVFYVPALAAVIFVFSASADPWWALAAGTADLLLANALTWWIYVAADL